MRPSLAADLNVAFIPPVRQLGGTVPGVEAYGWPGLCPCRLHPNFRQLVGKTLIQLLRKFNQTLPASFVCRFQRAAISSQHRSRLVFAVSS